MYKDLFDRLAPTYDADIIEADIRGEFPFAGYQKILDFIASDIEKEPRFGKSRILDLGIGTGNLEAKIKPEKIEVTGVDASAKMLEIAQFKLPSARLFCGDFQVGLPEEIKNDKFDIIVSTFAMHHLDLDEWLEYVHYLSHHLTVFGKIYIGDILFVNESEKRNCHAEHPESWDETEYYQVYEEVIARICEHLATSFVKVSYCTGIIIIENYHECTLHNHELLVKY